MTAYLNGALTDIFRQDGKHRIINIELVGANIHVHHDFESEDVETPVSMTGFLEALKSRTGTQP